MRAACLLVLSACSFFTTEGPAPAPGPTRCNVQQTPVAVDAVLGVGAALAAAVAGLEGGGRNDLLAPAAAAGLFAISSGYGFVEVRRCRAAHALRPQRSLADMPAVM